MSTFATVRADEVREGDWVRWPEESDTMRLITARTGGWRDGERVYVGAYSEYDDHEYEWLNSQPVVVLREASPCDDAAVGRATDALLADSGIPRYGGYRANIERRVRIALRAAGESGPDPSKSGSPNSAGTETAEPS